MVVYAVGKLYLLEISLEGLEVGVVTVALVVGVDPFDEVADGEVVFTVLIPQHVAAGDCSLGEIVDEDALLRGEFLKPGHLIAEHLDVGEAVGGVIKVGRRGLVVALRAG